MPQPFSFSLPPRDVPLTVRLRVLFGGVFNQLGWFFFGFGMIFVWIFLPNVDVTSFYSFRGQLQQTQGTVTASQKTHFTEGGSKHHSGTPVYRHEYTFTVDESRYDGVSFSKGQSPQPGARVTVEYPRGNPSLSRIHGMRRAAFGPAALLVLIFPLVGAGLLIPGLTQGGRANRLLATGKVACGTFQSKVPTNTRVNGRTVYKLTFQFTTDTGQTCQAVARTWQPQLLEDGQQQEVVYDPLTPAYAVMVDSLPGSPEIDERGVIQPASFGSALRITLLPTIIIVANTTCLCFKLLR